MMSYLQRYMMANMSKSGTTCSYCSPSHAISEAQYPDIYAVVQETMRRVRHNIEYLIPRLVQIGYVFGYDHVVHQLSLTTSALR